MVDSLLDSLFFVNQGAIVDIVESQTNFFDQSDGEKRTKMIHKIWTDAKGFEVVLTCFQESPVEWKGRLAIAIVSQGHVLEVVVGKFAIKDGPKKIHLSQVGGFRLVVFEEMDWFEGIKDTGGTVDELADKTRSRSPTGHDENLLLDLKKKI